MKQEDDKWLSAFRERMKDYSEPVPEDLWNSLEKELEATPVRRIYPYRWAAIAATVLLMIISSVSLFWVFSPADEYLNEVAESTDIFPPSDNILPDIPKEPGLISKNENEVPKSVRSTHGNQKRINSTKVTDDITVAQTINTDISEEITDITESETHVPDTSNVKQNVIRNNKIPDSDFSYTTSSNNLLSYNSGKSKGNKWSVSLSMGNSPVDATNSTPGYDAFLALDNSPDYYVNSVPGTEEEIAKPNNNLVMSDSRKQVFLNTLDQDTRTDIEHKMPFTIGASFRYNLSKQFAIESGLMYTQLSSELRSGSQRDYYIEENKIHYLGIPLKGNWKFLDTRYFTLYISAGGAMEKAISGEVKKKTFIYDEVSERENRDLDIDQLQWSLSAAVGAQYNITDHFGIYVEPGVVHYFDDGSSIETIRKKKPTNFNLQLGLRLTY